MRGRIVWALRVGALLAAVAACGPSAGAAQALRPCRLEGVAVEALCGNLRRPLDPTRTAGAQIDVHYAVLPAVSRSKREDPVFFFAGGPGQSAIDLAGPVDHLLTRLRNRRDVVLIDQRGTGRSAGLYCDADDPARPLREQVDPAQQRLQLAACRTRLQRLPHGALAHYTTPIAVADADAVRHALGYRRINAIGVSYGTRVVLDYLRQYPANLRRLVLDGVAPPDMRLPASMPVDTQAAFDALLAACEQDSACAGRHPRLRAQWRELLAQAPRTVSVLHPHTGRSEELLLNAETLAALVRVPLYTPVLSSAVPLAIAEAAEGRYAALLGLASALYSGQRRPLAMGMHFSVVCSEDMPPSAASSSAEARLDFDSVSALYREVCAAWPRAELPAGFFELRPAPVAALLLSGGLDPVTAPRHAARVADALGPRARHVVLPNAGHGLLGLPCMRDAVHRFVDAADDAAALATEIGCASSMPRPPMFAAQEAAR